MMCEWEERTPPSILIKLKIELRHCTNKRMGAQFLIKLKLKKEFVPSIHSPN